VPEKGSSGFEPQPRLFMLGTILTELEEEMRKEGEQEEGGTHSAHKGIQLLFVGESK